MHTKIYTHVYILMKVQTLQPLIPVSDLWGGRRGKIGLETLKGIHPIKLNYFI